MTVPPVNQHATKTLKGAFKVASKSSQSAPPEASIINEESLELVKKKAKVQGAMCNAASGCTT